MAQGTLSTDRIATRLRTHVQLRTLSPGAVILLAAITFAAAVLRLLFLGRYSFIGDEILSVMFVSGSWSDLWHIMAESEANMALYYILLHFWVDIGQSDAFVRVLSAVLGAATVPAIFFLGKRLFTAEVGLIAALLLAVHPFHLQYSQLARSYSLLLLLLTVSSILLARSLERSTWQNWTGYAVVTALTVYSHIFACLFLLAHVGSLLLLDRRQVPWKHVIASYFGIGFLLLPMVGFLFTESASSRIAWVQELSWQEAYEFLVVLSGNSGTLLLLLLLIPLGTALVLAFRTWIVQSASLETWKYGMLIIWLVFPILASAAVSMLVTPIFVARFLIICLPPLIVLVAAGLWRLFDIAWLRAPLIGGSILVAILALSAQTTLGYYSDEDRRGWREASDLLLSHWQPGDGILFYVPWADTLARYYLERGNPEIMEDDLLPAGRQLHTLFGRGDPSHEEVLELIPADRSRIWLLVSGSLRIENRRAHVEKIRDVLTSEFPYQGAVPFPKGITAHIYSRQALPDSLVHASAASVKAQCGSRPATISGTYGNDVLTGTEGDDVIHGLEGNDVIQGLGGEDIICGGNGDDAIQGGDSNDKIWGGEGNDRLSGGQGNDLLNGNDGNDQLFGDEGDDILNSGPGDDHLDGGPGTDACRGQGVNTKANCE